MRFQTTLESAECLRRSDAGWHSDEECEFTNRCTTRRWCDKEQTSTKIAHLFLVSTSATRHSSLARYGGAVPCKHRKTRTESLISIRTGTRSQWRSRSSGVMCSYFRAEQTSRAAVFITDCSLLIWLTGRPASLVSYKAGQWRWTEVSYKKYDKIQYNTIKYNKQ